MGNLYETVINKAERSKYWRIADMLKLSKETPLETLKAMIQASAERNEDDEAAAIVAMIEDACQDVQFVPLLVDRRIPQLPNRSEQDDEVRAQTAVEMMNVYGALPPHRIDGKRRDGNQFVPNKVACLHKTRAELLESIAFRWARTRIETEADALIDFLLREAASAYSEYVAIAVKAIREATNDMPTGERLANAYRKACRGRQSLELLKVLRIAWSRNREDKAFLRELDVMAPLVEAPVAVTHYAKRCVEQAIEANRKAATLIAAIKTNSEIHAAHCHMSECYAEPYAALPNGFLLRVSVDPAWSPWAHTRDRLFRLARSEINAWRKANPGVPVRLIVEHVPIPELQMQPWVREVTIK